ncbi:syntaxin [Laetiporus sulphureus 93-53]|uniref:Syntaxin n=1 Tax=Laetiporus sulphureus 93-53 TaxID=1314785 RepID=A0A165EF12_9APHY|nr:syntaxin [Laetiporus sulphureus 93-53]KZT06913.1 syntaxin [Laetiporus sulphureus 93-53]
MSALQAIHIRGYDERSQPKPHVVYRIEIQASVRSWQMWRRYSEFVDLHIELAKSIGAPPPAELPPKRAFSIFKGLRDPHLLEERREGLELYLRAILSARDDRWRESFAFRDFLGIPVGKHNGIDNGAPSQFTSASWLDEHQELQARIRDVRADINKRDALSDRGDISASHQSNVQAKKKLAGILTRIGVLEDGLRTLGMSGMSEGELQRRNDMVARLRDDCEKLAKMVTVARMTARGLGSSAERNPAAPSDRAALVGTSSLTGFSKPATRVFGTAAPPRETDRTRPLDDHGLVQLQETQMAEQDQQLAQLTTILQRQRHLGLAISDEVARQIEDLDDLTNNIDRVGGKLSNAKKQLNRLG